MAAFRGRRQPEKTRQFAGMRGKNDSGAKRFEQVGSVGQGVEAVGVDDLGGVRQLVQQPVYECVAGVAATEAGADQEGGGTGERCGDFSSGGSPPGR